MVKNDVLFGAAAAAFMQHRRTEISAATQKKHQFFLNCLHSLWTRPVRDIGSAELLEVLQGIQARGHRHTGLRVGRFAGEVFNYALAHEWVQRNPVPKLRGLLKPDRTVSHAGITDPEQFGKLMRFVDDLWMYGSIPSVYNGLAVIARTFVRPGELRGARWSEFDRAKAEWRIDAARMKMRRPHLVPLSAQVLKILEDQHIYSGQGELVFPGMRKGRPLSDVAMNICMKQTVGIDSSVHTVHGFRVSASTLLNDLNEFNPAVIELQLSHAKKDKIAGIYDRSQRVPDRVKLMQRWADYIDELKEKAR